MKKRLEHFCFDLTDIADCGNPQGRHHFPYPITSSCVRVPDGTKCKCGKCVAKWKVCPTCGHETLKAIPVETKQSTPHSGSVAQNDGAEAQNGPGRLARN